MSRYNNSITKRVIDSIGILGSTQAISIVCSVVRTKCVALWLGTVGVGFNSILVNSSTLISTISQLNIRESSVRDIATISDVAQRQLKCAVVRRWALISGIFGAILMILASPLLSISAYDGSLDYSIYFAWLAPFVFFSAYAAGENALMQAEDKLRSIARANVVSTAVSTAITIVLLYIYGLKAIVASINIYALFSAITAYIWRVRLPRSNVRLNRKILWSQGRSFLFLGASISFSLVLTILAQYIFAAYINSTGGESDLGIYQSGYTLITAYVGIIFSAMALEYYPRLASMISHPERTRIVLSYQVVLTIALMMPIIVIFISISDIIVKILYSSSFESVLPYVNYAVIGSVFRGISACFAYRILAAGDSKAYMTTECLSILTGLGLNIWAYSQWSLTGLGVSYIVWYAIYTAIAGVTCRIRYGMHIPLRLLWLIGLAVISGLASIVLKDYFGRWMPLCTILPWMLPLSICLIFRRNFKNGKSNALV